MSLESVELYPKIVVYKNLFLNIDNMYKTLKDSLNNDSNSIFSEWRQWSSFGKYLNPVSNAINWNEELNEGLHNKIDLSVLDAEGDKDQREFVIDLMKNFWLATEDYTQRYGIEIDSEPETEWIYTAPVICKYDNITNESRLMTMNYHSDYIREPIISPGYKFAITALAYFNDDYEGGEIDFAIGNKLLKYKPEAGDFIFFPSGHPEILTDDGDVYLHGVLPVTSGNNKIFSRMFWKKKHQGSLEWEEKENQFGKEVWASMQEELLTKFRQEHKQRSVIKDSVRIM